MPEPTISDILGWGGGTFGAGADMGGMGLSDYLTNILSEAGQYEDVLGEGFQAQMHQIGTQWNPAWTYQGTFQDIFHPGEFASGQNITEGLGLGDISDIMGQADFLGLDRDALEGLVEQAYSGQLSGYETDISPEAWMNQYITEQEGGGYGLNVGISNLETGSAAQEAWQTSFTGETQEEVLANLEAAMAEGGDISMAEALYGDYQSWFEGMGSPTSNPWSGELSEEEFLSNLHAQQESISGEHYWGWGDVFDPSESDIYQNVFQDVGFEEGDLDSILNYMQSMQEGQRSIGSAQGQYDVGRRLKGAESGAGRVKESALQGYIPGEIATRYGGLQGGIGASAGEGAETGYLSQLASAERKRARDVRGIHKGYEGATYGAAQRWLEDMLT